MFAQSLVSGTGQSMCRTEESSFWLRWLAKSVRIVIQCNWPFLGGSGRQHRNLIDHVLHLVT